MLIQSLQRRILELEMALAKKLQRSIKLTIIFLIIPITN